ncbi:Hsp20/alpha crystallin family protein [candidate division KSB1 bacterium]|nr:Hsp20/alpha crystallin family protein [candidate division KSB1 bacterium]
MTLVKWQPTRSLFRPSFFFDDLFGLNRPFFDRDFSPRMDIVEKKNDFVLSAELPGVNKEDVKVTVEDDMLTIKGEKKIEKVNDEGNFYHAERAYGSFCRSFRLGEEVLRDKIKAQFKDGVLTVNLPKAKVVEPKAIKISVN